MMIGTPTESSIWTGYLLTIFIVVTGFSVYDILYRRVPNRALVFFMPLAALAPILKTYFIFKSHQISYLIWSPTMVALLGLFFGFCIPLAAAITTNGNGIGGGDIKFCGILGLIYGPFGMSLLFLVAALFALPVVFVLSRFLHNTHSVSIPFLPFLTCGCCVATLVQLF